jgi:hypothetical protein
MVSYGPGYVVTQTAAWIPIRHLQIGHTNRYDMRFRPLRYFVEHTHDPMTSYVPANFVLRGEVWMDTACDAQQWHKKIAVFVFFYPSSTLDHLHHPLTTSITYCSQRRGEHVL